MAAKKVKRRPTPGRAAIPPKAQANPASSFDVKAWASRADVNAEYTSGIGAAVVGNSDTILASKAGKALQGKVQLVFTSPPFPLNRKKKYDNLEGKEFLKWLRSYALPLRDLLRSDGSIVMEMGNAWKPGVPVMSTLAVETLLAFMKAARLHLVQEFIWFNPARLPTPAQWVTIERIRVKDAFTRLWWLAPSTNPKADNRRVLAPYSGSMNTLLETGKYNSGRRPSEHVINPKSFLTDNGGAIPPNVLLIDDDRPPASNLLMGANTNGNDAYQLFCKSRGLELHPARMPMGLAKFFINLCTDPGDLVVDPFGGSNTTGAAAEELGRRWVSIEANQEYARGGRGRFPELAADVPKLSKAELKRLVGDKAKASKSRGKAGRTRVSRERFE
jgi:DNA modification methylase